MSLQRYNSNFSNLVVSGCSFTINESPNSHVSWPNCLAIWSGMNIKNLAVCGAGNKHIADSIILYLEKNKPNPKNTLVIAMWSGIDRINWIVDKTMMPVDKDWRFVYDYDCFNELLSSSKKYNNSKVKDAFNHYKLFQTNKTEALNSWLAIESLTNYLKANRYTYLYTAFQNIFTGTTFDFENHLRSIGLSINKDNWFPTEYNSFLGEYAKIKKLTAADGWHPSVECHELWVEEILVPEFINRKIISVKN